MRLLVYLRGDRGCRFTGVGLRGLPRLEGWQWVAEVQGWAVVKGRPGWRGSAADRRSRRTAVRPVVGVAVKGRRRRGDEAGC